MVAKARPDGYTIGVATTSTHAVSVSVYKKLPYDPVTDFEYAGFIGASPFLLVVNAGINAPDVKSLITLLRKNPDRYSFASVGAGTVSHLLGEQFKAIVGTPLVHVPYKGSSPAYTDLIGGQVQMMFDNPESLSPQLQAGTLRAIATTAPTVLANIPTFAQQGYPAFDSSLWYGLVFPKGTAADIVQKFNAALNKVLADPAVDKAFASKGINVQPGTRGAMLAAVTKDVQYWAGMARSVGIALD